MSGTDSPNPVRLTPVRRLRVLVRRALFAGLRAVPDAVVAAIHDRWIEPSGRRRPRWRPLAAILFYRPVPASAVTVPGGAGERLRVVGSRMERTLWWYGEAGYEGGEAAHWRRWCSASTNVLEVGANIGYYSVVGARATHGTYTTVEPNPEAARVVRANLALNDRSHVDVVEAAVVGAGAPDEVELAFPDQESHSTAPTGAFLREGTERVTGRPASRSIRVPTVPAAPLFAGRDLVKLDIEGSEASVLEAAWEEIGASRPVVLVEVLAGATRLRDLIGRLVDEGYRLSALDVPSRPLSVGELAGPRNLDVLLVPAERTDVV